MDEIWENRKPIGKFIIKIYQNRGAWVAQSIKRLPLDLSADHDLMVCEIEPHVGLCTDSKEPA